MSAYGPSTALLVVDCQNDFADPEGSLYITGGEEVVAAANREIIRAVSSESPVVYTKDWHPPSTPHFEKDGGVWPVHCVADAWGAELHRRLLVAGPAVLKGTKGEDGYSGFTMRDPESGDEMPTPLDGLLRDLGVETTVVVGLALDVCVRATALDAIDLGYQTLLPRSGSAPVDMEEGDGDRAVREMAEAGVEILDR